MSPSRRVSGLRRRRSTFVHSVYERLLACFRGRVTGGWPSHPEAAPPCSCGPAPPSDLWSLGLNAGPGVALRFNPTLSLMRHIARVCTGLPWSMVHPCGSLALSVVVGVGWDGGRSGAIRDDPFRLATHRGLDPGLADKYKVHLRTVRRATESWSRLCAAFVDRITFPAAIIETGTESYRLRATTRNNTWQRAIAAAAAPRPPTLWGQTTGEPGPVQPTP